MPKNSYTYNSIAIALECMLENGTASETSTNITYIKGGDVQKYKYNGKELDRQYNLNLYDYGARYYDSVLGLWTTQDPMGEKYYAFNSYGHCGNNPLNAIDPDGKDWFEYQRKGSKEKTWNWHEGSEYKLKIGIDAHGKDVFQTLQGQKAVVVFNGNLNEKLGEGQKMTGKGAVLAFVTVYGPGGAGDVKTYDGYSMSSDPSKFGVVADGSYIVNRIGAGEKKGPYGSEWTLNKRGKVPEQDDYNPAHPERKPAYLEGVFIHRPNNDGWAGTFQKEGKIHGVSEGCLLITPTKWTNFNNQLKTVNRFMLQINR